ncbi:RNA polymerase sigma-70 factor [Puteibacter caeruleilacunae]|nr:RNA polymerase sigma-70 factor [Puteibacter caeruleilacunae]
MNTTVNLLKTQAEIEERKYLAALKNGDTKSFDKLFSEYGKRLYHFSYGYLKSTEKAEDVVQEVFLRIWRNRHQLNPNLSFKAYVFKIAYHHILELFEQNNRQQVYQHQLLEESFVFNDDTNERLNYQMLLEKVENLILKLPERQRQVLLKRRKEGISIKEIASQLDIAPKTVENHLTEALKNIKKGLKEEEISELLFFFILHNHLN